MSYSSLTHTKRKLIDYTKQGRPDMACNRGTPGTTSRGDMKESVDFEESFYSRIGDSPIIISGSSSSIDMDDSIEFFLKIPPRMSRRSSCGEDLVSRRDAFLIAMSEKERQQNSIGNTSRRNSSVERTMSRRGSLFYLSNRKSSSWRRFSQNNVTTNNPLFLLLSYCPLSFFVPAIASVLRVWKAQEHRLWLSTQSW